MKISAAISLKYKKPTIEAAVLCSILLVLSFMVMDYGEAFFASFYATVAFWTGVILIVLRRPQTPTPTDIRFIRFGSLLAVVIAQLLSPWIWHLRGLP